MDKKYVVNLTIRNTFIIENEISDSDVVIIKGKIEKVVKDCIGELEISMNERA